MATNTISIDARGLKCPLPVLKLEKAAANAESGTIIILRATDAMAKIDVPLYCRQNGHSCAVVSHESEIELTVTVG